MNFDIVIILWVTHLISLFGWIPLPFWPRLRAVAESPTLAVHILRQGRWPVAFMVDVVGIDDQFTIGGGKALVAAHGMQVLPGGWANWMDEIAEDRLYDPCRSWKTTYKLLYQICMCSMNIFWPPLKIKYALLSLLCKKNRGATCLVYRTTLSWLTCLPSLSPFFVDRVGNPFWFVLHSVTGMYSWKYIQYIIGEHIWNGY